MSLKLTARRASLQLREAAARTAHRKYDAVIYGAHELPVTW
ncbi:hypothetical protein ACIGDI_19515 [Streptomyces sp. NPDC085900]